MKLIINENTYGWMGITLKGTLTAKIVLSTDEL